MQKSVDSEEGPKARNRRKITQELDTWIVNSNLAEVCQNGDTRPLGLSFFKQLKKTAVEGGLMDEDTATPEGVRTCVNDYFADLAASRKALGQSSSSTGV